MFIDIKKILDEFSKETKEKRYNRINYNIWRDLSKIDGCRLSFTLDPNKNIAKIQSAGKTYEFDCNDKSFGYFLYNKYWGEIGATDIYINTNTKETNSDMATSAHITLSNPIYTKGDNSATYYATNYIDSDYDPSINDNNTRKEKENKNMFNKFDFGPIDNGTVRFSPYGMSILNDNGKWVSYDVRRNQIVETDGFTFKMENMLYKIPVAVKDVRPGDMIIHNGNCVYVIENINGNIKVVNITAGEQRVILPPSNMFGFNFVTKIVSMLDMAGLGCGTPTADQPFGNILPMLIMSQMFGDKSKNKNDDFGQIMMMSMLFNNQNPFTNMFTNTLQFTQSVTPPMTPCECATSGTTLNPANAPTI